jgi:hypothetical protein
MASTVEIANRALSKLGEARITSLDDNSKPARAMKARFDLVRDAELASYAWRFAVKRVPLAAAVEVPEWGFARIFPRPVDDLRPLKIANAYVDFRTIGVTVSYSSRVPDLPYEVIDGKIYTDLPAPLEYEYVSRVTNSGAFDALFVEALACRLAADAAEELTQSNTKIEQAMRQYDLAIKMARRVHALYVPPARKPTGAFMQSRFY